MHSSMGHQQHKIPLDRLFSRKKSEAIIHIFAIYLNAGQEELSDGQWVIVVHLGWSLPAAAQSESPIFIMLWLSYLC